MQEVDEEMGDILAVRSAVPRRAFFAQVAADLGRLDSLILAGRRQMNETEYSASYSTYSPRTFTYG